MSSVQIPKEVFGLWKKTDSFFSIPVNSVNIENLIQLTILRKKL